MANQEHIQLLVTEIGPAMEPVSIRQHGENLWSIAFDESTLLSLAFDEEQQKLTLEQTLSKPDDDRRTATYSALLTYSFLTEQSGGVKMALDQMYGNVVTTFDLCTVDLSVAKLRTVLEHFLEISRFWAGVLERGGVAPDEEFAVDDSKETMLGVRV